MYYSEGYFFWADNEDRLCLTDLPLYVKSISSPATELFSVSKKVWRGIGSLFALFVLYLNWDLELLWKKRVLTF